MSKVKQEKFVFKKPPTFRDYFIGLSKRPCMQRSPIQNPDNLPGLRLSEDDDLMPRVGEAPDEDAPLEHVGGAGFKEACLVVSLQNLGLSVVCDTDGPFTISLGTRYCVPLVFSYVTMICPLCRMASTLCMMQRKSISLPCPCGRASSRSSTTLRLPRSPCLA